MCAGIYTQNLQNGGSKVGPVETDTRLRESLVGSLGAAIHAPCAHEHVPVRPAVPPCTHMHGLSAFYERMRLRVSSQESLWRKPSLRKSENSPGTTSEFQILGWRIGPGILY